jgi:hypothetical protein
VSDRFQFVWWGLSRWQFGFCRWEGSLRAIYRYSVNLGPFEIRRWETRPSPEDQRTWRAIAESMALDGFTEEHKQNG